MYSDLEEINEIANALAELSDDQIEAFGLYCDEGYSYDDALRHAENWDYIYYSDCYNMEDVARRLLDECGLLDGAPEFLIRYFDFESYGRDLDLEGRFFEAENGYIELTA